MINQQWGSCEFCGRDLKYVKFLDDGTENLICKLDCKPIELFMEDANSISVAVHDLLETRLKNFNILLDNTKSDEIYDGITKIVEDFSNGIYRNHN